MAKVDETVCRKCGADLMAHEERYCDDCVAAKAAARRTYIADPYTRHETMK